MISHAGTRTSIAVALFFALAAGPVAGQELFAIVSGEYSEGCVPPCTCPVVLYPDVYGEFRLTPLGKNAGFEEYTVDDFFAGVWLDVGAIEITGSGSYRRSIGEPATHEMTLELEVDGEAGVFASGPVAAQFRLPVLDIAIDDGGDCFRRTLKFEAEAIHSDAYFLRGDANGDGIFNALLDALYLLGYQFIPGSPVPPCLEAADADDDGAVNGLQDALAILSAGFQPGTPPLPPPFPECGIEGPGIGCDDSGCL